MRHAIRSAEIHKPRYAIGDVINIYYNSNNPDDWRMDIGYASENVLNTIAIIIIGLRGVILTKTILNYNKENPKNNYIN